MKNKKVLALICCVTLNMGMILGGCGSSNSSNSDATTESDSSDTAEAEGEMPQMPEADVYGQITAIDGNTITIALAEQPTRPEGEVPEVPEGSDSAEAPSDQESMELTLTGEETTITIDDSTVINLMNSQKKGDPAEESTEASTEDDAATGTAADLAVDDVISVDLEGDTVVSITVGGGFGGGKQGQRPESDSNSESTEKDGTTEEETAGSNE